MVHRFQEFQNYDDYDPAPYQGGYDQQDAYGSIRKADQQCGYRRTDFGEDEEEQVVEYGRESNPYRHGPPGPSIYGGYPSPGGVYGGGRDRTGRRSDEAQPDEGVETGYGRHYPTDGEEWENRKPRPAYGEEEESYEEEGHGKRNPRRAYDDEVPEELRNQQSRRGHSDEQYHSSYSRTSYGEEVPQEEGYGSGYGQKAYGNEVTEDHNYSGHYGRVKKHDTDGVEGYESHEYHRKKDDEETEESGDGDGYGRKKKKNESEDEDEGSDCSRGSRKKNDSEDEGSDGSKGRRKKKIDDDEEENENRGYGGYRSRRNDDEEEEEAPKKSWW